MRPFRSSKHGVGDRSREGRPPHVCMLVHSTFPVGEPRGEREARAALEAGYDVHVISLRLPGQPASASVDGIHVIRLPVMHVRGATRVQMVREYTAFTARASMATLALHRRAPIDVVYIHAPPDFLVVAGLLPRILGCKVVLDIHDLSPHMYDARFGHRRGAAMAHRFLRAIERRSCTLADYVVTVHEPYRTELMANGVPPDKLAVVMNTPEEDLVELIANGRSWARDREDFTVAYHGTLTHWYGVDLLVEAIADLERRIPRLKALILGEGDALVSIERLAHQLTVDDLVEFSRAYVPYEDALRAVADASCGVVPNRSSKLNRFALSSKLFEYVALGVPVVVARLETLAAHFGPDEVTFFEPDNAGSLSDAIAWVAEHPAEARDKAARARIRAQAYAWPESRARLLEVLACGKS